MNPPAIDTVQIGMTAVTGRTGGVDRYYYNLLRALPATGTGVHGLVVGDASSLADPTTPIASFASVEDSMLGRWRGMRRAAPPLFAHTDLIVSHFAPYAFPILDATITHPLVVHFHGPWALESRAEGAGAVTVMLRAFIERAVYARARRFIVLSAAFADVLAANYGVKRAIIDVVPGGVDLSRFRALSSRAEARDRLQWPADRRIVATVRRLVPSKGIENLIAAAAALRTAHPDILVQIVGTGPLERELQRQIHEAHLEDHVRLAGFVADDDLPYVYRAADLFIVPTVALEGFGLVVVESLACGTPALVTPIGGLPEVVRGLDASLILPGAMTADITTGLARALAGDLSLPSEAACIEYAQRFDWPSVAQSVSASYRKALA